MMCFEAEDFLLFEPQKIYRSFVLRTDLGEPEVIIDAVEVLGM